MNKKGFTLIEMLAVIIILGIILSFSSYSFYKYITSSSKKSFDIAVKSFKDATEAAYADCNANFSLNTFCSNHSIPEVGSTDTIYLSELVDNQYIDKIKNPYDTSTFCSETSSYIIVSTHSKDITHNGEIVGTENNDITYKVCLVCDNNRSEDCD